jgi:DNA-binding NtrC family response regulator
MLTGFPSIEGAVEAVKGGAEAYLTKPFTKRELLDRVAEVLAVQGRSSVVGNDLRPPVLAGRSDAAAGLRRDIAAHGPGRAAVLVEGSPGSGAVAVAHALHDASERADAPFELVACHLPGAGSAATLFDGDHCAVARADGGTLVLEGIGALDEVAQLHLYRLLQERRRVPTDGGRPRASDVRVIAIARRHLAALVAGGALRRDLLDRLTPTTITVPPLADRREDVVDIVHTVTAREATLWRVEAPTLTDRALEALTGADWNGGLPELVHVVRSLYPGLAGRTVDAADLPARFRFQAVPPTGLLPTLRELEASHIRTVLERVGGNKTEAARILGIDRKTLRAKLGR